MIRELARQIGGAMLLLSIWILLIANWNLAEAQGVTRVTAGGLIINMQDPQKIEFHCREGELVGPSKTKTAWVLSCKKKSNGGTPPPPSDCPKPLYDVGTGEQAPQLFHGERKYVISGHATTMYQFNSDQIMGFLGHSQIGPAPDAGSPVLSNLTTQTVTECPGVLDPQYVRGIDAGCFRSGQISTIKLQRGGNHTNCNLKPGKRYFLNISAVNPVTKQPMCNQCGVVHNTKLRK